MNPSIAKGIQNCKDRKGENFSHLSFKFSPEDLENNVFSGDVYKNNYECSNFRESNDFSNFVYEAKDVDY